MVNNDKNLSSGEICPHEKGGDKSVLSQFALFCRKITFCCNLRCFVAKSVLSQFMRFCVEKNLTTIVSVETNLTTIVSVERK